MIRSTLGTGASAELIGGLVFGWLYHRFHSAVIGALWGVVWWILGALTLMPSMLGMPVFAALRMAPMRPVAIGSLMGHLLFGVILGLAYVRLCALTLVGTNASSAARPVAQSS